MAGSAATDDSGASTAGMRDDERSMSGESLSEWRSCERADSDSPSTSPPFWDTDGDDDDPGPRPSDLFGRYTWRIENFSKEKKREMKSEPFEAGGYKWYILVYPQGCDVSNHLSLFLCVANHDKLLPGWSHFAQFTIAVGNIDPKKMKYSDTLHKFWKKEHDWGWKKFMELSKIQDGFLVDDVLEIIAQVQVIREKVDRPFRCLDRPYRRELLRVYMTNVEQIYRRFVEERRSKLSKLIEDKTRWSSFRAFWSAIDPGTKHRMSREKADTVLKVLVKHFFVEKEVTSTLVMDSLYTSLKALEYQKGKRGGTKLADLEELPAPMVHVDMDMFVLAGDVIALLERAAIEPLPCQTLAPKDDKSSQSRIKDGSSGEVYKVSMECEERRLTEFGQKIIETFVLSHIFSGIEIAYQEAVALKRQEELIREEEAEGLLENQMKGKRGGGANEKEKRAKKKQAKQKKNNRKIKDKERNEKREVKILERFHDETAIDDSDSLPAKEVAMRAKVDALEDCASDGSDISTRGRNQRNKGSFAEEGDGLPSTSSIAGDSSRSGTASKLDQDTVLLNLRDKLRKLGQQLHEKNIEGQKLLKAHFEASDAKAKGEESSNSSCSSEKPCDVLESPKHSSEVPVDLKVDGTPNKNASEVNYAPEVAVSGMPATNSKLVPLPATTNVDPVSDKDNASSSKTKACIASPCCSKLPPNAMDKDTPLPSKSPRVTRAPPKSASDKTTPVTPKSPPVDRATPVNSKSSAVDKATPVRPKSPAVDKAISVHPKSPAVDKVSPIRPISPAVEKAAPIRPKSPAVQKGAPVYPKSPAVDKASPVRTNSPAADKFSPALLKSPTGTNDASIPSRSLQIDKNIPAPSRLLQVDNGALSSSELPQTSPATSSEAQKEATSVRVATTSVSDVAVAASRPSSAPAFPTPRTTAPHVQKSTLLSRSISEAAGRSTNEPTPSAPPYVPQTYRNAIIGKPGLGSTSAGLVYQSASFGQDTARSQSLSAYASSTAAVMPPAGRSDQLLTRHGFKSGLGTSEAHDSYQLWKVDSNVDKQVSRDSTPYQQMTNSLAYGEHRRDDTYQHASSRGTEKPSRYGLQSRQFQPETTASRVWPLPQGPAAEEFPHLDIINDLLEEDHINGNMPGSLRHDYNAFGLPFLPRGNSTDLGVASLSSPGRFNSTEPYYDDGFSRAYDMRPFQGSRERQFPSMGTYCNGVSDMSASKPWLIGSPSPPLSIGVDTNGFHQQVGDFTNSESGLNGVSVWRRHANGRW